MRERSLYWISLSAFPWFKATAKLGQFLEARASQSFIREPPSFTGRLGRDWVSCAVYNGEAYTICHASSSVLADASPRCRPQQEIANLTNQLIESGGYFRGGPIPIMGVRTQADAHFSA